MMGRWWKLVRGNIRANPLRTVLATLGISLGIALVFAVQIANTSVEKSITDQTSMLFGDTDVNVAVPLYSKAILSEKDLQTIADMEETAKTNAILQGYVKQNGQKTPLFVKGIETETAKEIGGYDVVEGDWFTSATAESLMISEQMAKDYKLSLGDTVTVEAEDGQVDLTVQAIVSAVGEGQELTKQGGLVPLAVSRELLGIEKGYNEIGVVLKEGKGTNAVVKQLEKQFDTFDITDKSEVNAQMKSSLDDLQSGLLFLTVISVILGGFIIYHTFSVIIAQRIKEIATFRALGATGKSITSMMLLESLAIGVLGIVLGLVFGFGLGYLFLNIFSQATTSGSTSYTIPINGVLLTIIIGLIVTLLASWIPVRAASKKSPLEAFDQSHIQVDQRNEKLPIKRGILGFIILAIGIWGWIQTIGVSEQYKALISLLGIFVGIVLVIPILVTPLMKIAAKLLNLLFGFKGKLAALTLLRSKKRAFLSITLVCITLTTILGITTLTGAVQSGWTESLRKTVGYDLIVQPVGENFQDNFKNKLEKVDGTDQITSINTIFIEREDLGRSIRVDAVDMDAYYNMNSVITPDGFQAPDTALLSSNEAVSISEKIAAKLDLDVGDTFALKGNDGTIEMPVAAVYQEVDSGGFTVTVPKEIVDKAYEPKGRNGFFVSLKDDMTLQEWNKSLETFSWHDDVTVQSLEDTLRRTQAMLSQMFMPFQAVNMIVVITAMLGVGNTLLISVFERKKEIAMLRSIGAGKSHIKSFISMEGVTIGLLGIITGYPCGLFIGSLFIFWWRESMEAQVPFHFPLLGLTIGIVATLIITLIVSLLPASYAAKFDMVAHIK